MTGRGRARHPGAQSPAAQLPEQQSAVVMQLPPVVRHEVVRHVFAAQAKEQQSALPVHDPPAG